MYHTFHINSDFSFVVLSNSYLILPEQILSNRPDHHLILEKTGGLRAKLQYKETRLHLYCPRKASGDELVTQMKVKRNGDAVGKERTGMGRLEGDGGS